MMLNFLWSAFRRTRDPAIFYFHDGRRIGQVDIALTWQRLHADKSFRIQTDPDLIDVGDLDALIRTAEAVRRIFGVPLFKDGGLSTVACSNLLINFFDHTTDLRRRGIVFNPTPREAQLAQGGSNNGQQR